MPSCHLHLKCLIYLFKALHHWLYKTNQLHVVSKSHNKNHSFQRILTAIMEISEIGSLMKGFLHQMKKIPSLMTFQKNRKRKKSQTDSLMIIALVKVCINIFIQLQITVTGKYLNFCNPKNVWGRYGLVWGCPWATVLNIPPPASTTTASSLWWFQNDRKTWKCTNSSRANKW